MKTKIFFSKILHYKITEKNKMKRRNKVQKFDRNINYSEIVKLIKGE